MNSKRGEFSKMENDILKWDSVRQKFTSRSRIEYLQNENNYKWKKLIPKEMMNIRQENINGGKYSVMWLGLASFFLAISFQLSNINDNPYSLKLLVYIQMLFVITIFLFIYAAILFFHGSNTNHSLREYIEFNENGDSLIMLGGLIIMTNIFLLIPNFIIEINSKNIIIVSFIPITLMIIVFSAFNFICIKGKTKKNGKTHYEGIATHYLAEAGRIFFYRDLRKNPKLLINLLWGVKYTKGMVLIIFFLIIIILVFPYLILMF